MTSMCKENLGRVPLFGIVPGFICLSRALDMDAGGNPLPSFNTFSCTREAYRTMGENCSYRLDMEKFLVPDKPRIIAVLRY